jgi:hypothetical protein
MSPNERFVLYNLSRQKSFGETVSNSKKLTKVEIETFLKTIATESWLWPARNPMPCLWTILKTAAQSVSPFASLAGRLKI